MFSYRELRPHRPLDRFVRCFWFLEGEAPESDGAPEKILPDGCMEIVIHVGAPFCRVRDGVARTQSTAFLVGQLTGCLLLEPRGRVQVMGVRFTPSGTSAFLPFDLSAIQDEEVTVDELWDAHGRSLQEAVTNAGSDEERVRLVERFLLGRLSSRNVDHRLDEAVRLIQRNEPGTTVAGISRRVGLCERQLERLFLRKIGLNPKALLRTVRFQNLLQRARTGAARGGATLAVDCGFSDQAHLIREFKRFAGEPPEKFLGRDHALYQFFAPDV
jgi:AraC-like DNA-binding protein